MSLKRELARRLLLDMIKVAKGNDPAIVLVVDLHTSKILSSCLRMFDIMEAGVLVLQNLFLLREKLPDLPAIYFIDPSTECIKKLIEDFPAGSVSGAAAATASKNAVRAQYLNAHLYFTSHVPQAGMNMIKESPLIKKVRSFVELNVDFLAFESRVFLLDQPNTIPRIYFSNDATQLSLVLGAISKPLVSLCITFQEYPHVRYSALPLGSVNKSSPCKGLATFFDIDMKKTVSQLSDWKINESRERGTLLILDRSIDPIAPLLHEFTFQAMVNDVLPTKGEIVELPVSGKTENGVKKSQEELDADQAASEVVLSEEDQLWVDFRHKHIGTVMVDVTAKFKEFKAANKMAALQSEEKSSTKDMITAMKDLPAYKLMMKKYNKHMSLAQECMSEFDRRKLKQIGDLEQDMATGITSDGSSISLKDIKDRLISLCQDPRVGVLDKVRLVMIYTCSQGGLQESTRKELMKSVDVDLQQAIHNLDAIGVDKSLTDKKKKLSKERQKELEQHNKEQQLDLMRYLPVMHSVIEQLVTGNLKEESYPYTSPPPPGTATANGTSAARKGTSARKKTASANDWKSGDNGSSSSSAPAPASDDSVDLRPRFIVFVLGGVTFSEMRSAYEIADKLGVNLFIGGTNTLTPTEYIRDLSNLNPSAFEEAISHSNGGSAANGRSTGNGNGNGNYNGASSSSSVAARPTSASSVALVPPTSAAARRQTDYDSDDDMPVGHNRKN